MSDAGFDFTTPPRREAKSFEPPPWEQAAFEELERKRAEQHAAEQALTVQAESVVDVETAPESVVAAPAEQAGLVGTTKGAEGASEEAADTADDEKALDDRLVFEMMARLSAEEPKLHETTWKLEIAAAAVAGVIGCVMVVWGVAATMQARDAGLPGVTGSLALTLFGLGFVMVSGWMTVRTLRRRGVL